MLLAPSGPETQATDAPLTLTVDGNDGVSSESSTRKVSEGAFRVEPDPHTSKLHIVLPSADAWTSALENPSKSEGSDGMASSCCSSARARLRGPASGSFSASELSPRTGRYAGAGGVIRHPRAWRRVSHLSGPGAKTVSTSTFLDLLHQEMPLTFEHAEKYGWGV